MIARQTKGDAAELLILNYRILTTELQQVRLNMKKGFRQIELCPNAANCARGDRMKSITDPHVNDEGPIIYTY